MNEINDPRQTNAKNTHPIQRSIDTSWLKEIASARRNCEILQTLWVQGLEVKLWASDPALVRWVHTYLHPLPTLEKSFKSGVSTPYVVGCLYSDEIVLKAFRASEAAPSKLIRPGYEMTSLIQYVVGEGINIYLDHHEGVLSVVDRTESSLTIVFSSRTKWPGLEYARAVREVITRYLESEGWVQYHAGCVLTSRGALLLIGNKGAGKTTLLMTLMYTGERYVANERVFVKWNMDKVTVLGYPMAVAVGLGTALQFPELVGFIERPESLLYPQRRLDLNRISKTSKSDWPLLQDKVDFLARELTDVLKTEPPERCANLDAVVVPKVSPIPITPVARLLEQREVSKVFASNCLRRESDRVYPAWLDLGFPESENNINLVSTLPAVELNYHISRTNLKETERLIPLIYEVLP